MSTPNNPPDEHVKPCALTGPRRCIGCECCAVPWNQDSDYCECCIIEDIEEVKTV